MIKIVNFKGGLGNQILIYLFSKHLESKNDSNKVHGIYQSKNLRAHNGLEIEKVFNVTLPPTNILCKIITFTIIILAKLGMKKWISTEFEYKDDAIYYDGTWMDLKYFRNEYSKLKFNHIKLDETNQLYYNEILNHNSVFIHIRRGDYLLSKHYNTYNNICTKEYYNKAIEYIKKEIINPAFYIFSDDIEWVKDHLKLTNATYINYNKGENSYIDLYLMSKCKNCIIANSTFSYWGAMLGETKNNIVYPAKWMNTRTPNLFPETWVAINNKGEIQ